MSEDDLSYYEMRARQEANAAAAARDRPEVASAHRLLAVEYEAHARELRTQLRRQPMIVTTLS